jgi:hypothetical protein
MSKINYFNTVGHYVFLIMVLYQGKIFVKWLLKPKLKYNLTLTKRSIDETIAIEILKSTGIK